MLHLVLACLSVPSVSEAVVIEHVNTIPMDRERVSVVLADGRIAAIGPAGVRALRDAGGHCDERSIPRGARARGPGAGAGRATLSRRVVVLERGRVVQIGTHERLLAEGGVYGKLVRRQFEFAPSN